MGQFTEAKVGPLSIAGILILIGAIIGIIAVFLDWYSVTESFMGYTFSAHYTGWQFGFDGDLGLTEFQKYLPFIAWIFAIIALVVSILPLAKVNVLDPKMSGIIVIICGLLMLVLSIVFGMWAPEGGSKMMDHAAIGLWLMVVGGVLALIGGILPMIDKE